MEYIKTDIQIFINGKEIKDFSSDTGKIITVQESNGKSMLAIYDDFTSEVVLTFKQKLRFVKHLLKMIFLS